jgi:hypothetical protein
MVFANNLSLQNREEMMAERGISVERCHVNELHLLTLPLTRIPGGAFSMT